MGVVDVGRERTRRAVTEDHDAEGQVVVEEGHPGDKRKEAGLEGGGDVLVGKTDAGMHVFAEALWCAWLELVEEVEEGLVFVASQEIFAVEETGDDGMVVERRWGGREQARAWRGVEPSPG